METIKKNAIDRILELAPKYFRCNGAYQFFKKDFANALSDLIKTIAITDKLGDTSPPNNDSSESGIDLVKYWKYACLNDKYKKYILFDQTLAVYINTKKSNSIPYQTSIILSVNSNNIMTLRYNTIIQQISLSEFKSCLSAYHHFPDKCVLKEDEEFLKSEFKSI